MSRPANYTRHVRYFAGFADRSGRRDATPDEPAACFARVGPHNRAVEKLAAYLWVALGSALGGVSRFWVSEFIAEKAGRAFPWGTLLVNVSGSIAIGLLVTFTEPGSRLNSRLHPWVLQLFMIGICGGYTTFSAFSLQTLKLMQTGQWRSALLNVGLSILLCLMGVWLGHRLGSALNR